MIDLEQEIERIARQHELGSYCGSQFILDRRCLAALREMAAFTRKQIAQEIRQAKLGTTDRKAPDTRNV